MAISANVLVQSSIGMQGYFTMAHTEGETWTRVTANANASPTASPIANCFTPRDRTKRTTCFMAF